MGKKEKNYDAVIYENSAWKQEPRNLQRFSGKEMRELSLNKWRTEWCCLQETIEFSLFTALCPFLCDLRKWNVSRPSFPKSHSPITRGQKLIFNQGILMSRRCSDLELKYNEDPLSGFNLEFNGAITDHHILRWLMVHSGLESSPFTFHKELTSPTSLLDTELRKIAWKPFGENCCFTFDKWRL